MILSFLFYSTSIIFFNISRKDNVTYSTQIMSFERIKNLVEHDLRTASTLTVSETSIQYTVNQTHKRFYVTSNKVVCVLNYTTYKVYLSGVDQLTFLKTDYFIKLIFVSNDLIYETWVLYDGQTL